MNYAKIFIAVLFVLLFSLAAFAQKQAEVVVTYTYLRKSADYGAEKIQTLQKGEKVTFEKGRETGSWSYVSVGDGTIKGWVLTATLQTIKNAEKVAAKPTPTPQKTAPTPTQNPTTKTPPSNKNSTPKSAPMNQTATKTAPTPTPNATQNPPVNTLPTTTQTTPEMPEEDTETLKIDTEEVSLNVRVLNSGNRPVGNLKETAFKVYEDGVLQPVTSVSVAEVPIYNALVIDNSRSLRTQLSKVVEAGKIIVGANKPQDESSVVRFVSADKIEVVQDFTANKAMINNALDNLFVEGGQTAIIDAVYKAAEMIEKYQNSQKKDDVKLRTLILVSDGDDRGSQFSEKQLFELLRNSFVQIYAVGFPNDLSDTPDTDGGTSRRARAKAFLTRLAEETGGKVYFPESVDQLTKIASEISGELRTQYVVSYAPTNDKRDGSFRQIKVEVADDAKGEKRTAVTRTGRNAPLN